MDNFIKIVALVMAGYTLIEFGPRAAQFCDDVHAVRQQSESWQKTIEGIKSSIDNFKPKFWEPAPGNGAICGCGCGNSGCGCGMSRNDKQR